MDTYFLRKGIAGFMVLSCMVSGQVFADDAATSSDTGSTVDTTYTPTPNIMLTMDELAPYLRSDISDSDKTAVQTVVQSYTGSVQCIYRVNVNSYYNNCGYPSYSSFIEYVIITLLPYVRNDQQDNFTVYMREKVKWYSHIKDGTAYVPSPAVARSRSHIQSPSSQAIHRNTPVVTLSPGLLAKLNTLLDRVPQDRQSVVYQHILDTIKDKIASVEASEMSNVRKGHIVGLLKAVYKVVSDRLNSMNDANILDSIVSTDANSTADTSDTGSTDTAGQ